MQFIDNLLDNSILIIPNNLKTKVLEYINDNAILKSIKIMTFNEIKKGLLFDYEVEAIKATMDYLTVSFSVAINYINNLYFINEENYGDSKRKLLLKLKNYLLKNKFLIIDPLFKELVKSKKIVYVYGFDYINLFNSYLLDQIKTLTNVEIIEKGYNNYSHKIFEFKSIYDEVSFVFESILKLIDSGVSFNKIYIANYTEEYYFNFKTMMNLTGLPIYLKSNTSLYSTSIGTYFRNNLNNNIDSLLYKIKKKFRCDEIKNNEVVLNSLSNMLNNYYWCDGNYLNVKDLIENDMRLRKIPNRHFENEILTTNIIDNIFADDEYVFFIGFNLGNVPRLKKDEDFLDDSIKPKYLEQTNVYNKLVKDTLLKAIKNIKNLVITYKTGTPFKTCERSFLANNECFEIIKMENFISMFSNKLNELNLSRSLDSLIKFNNKDDNLDILFNNYNNYYKTYDNSFSGLDTDFLKENINDKLVFSYSNINDYYKCPFKFYVKYILGIKTYEVKLAQFIGSAFHYVLENVSNCNDDVDIHFDQYIELHKTDLKMTNKEKHFINYLRKEIHFVVQTIKNQQQHSKHTEEIHEKEIVLDVSRNIKTKIKGFVDKILVLNNSMLIIDYKTTSSQSIDTDILEFGLSTQLPMYLYLLKKINKDIEIAGIYVQHILDLDIKYEVDKDVLAEKQKKLRLDGLTFNDINLISNFDDTYEKSEVIKSLSTNKDGELKNNKHLLSLDERDTLITLMDSIIMNAIDSVCDGKFDISPIKIEKHADGCEYCDYKDICYRKFKDFNIQKLKPKEEDIDE